MSSFSRNQLEAWLKTITVNGRVLDIGGSQKPISNRVNGGSEYLIVDLETPHEIEQRPDVVHDFNLPLPESMLSMMQSFDHAFCIEVAEYWYNPLQALKNIGDLLKRGGKLYISFHLVYPTHNPEDQDCLRYTRSGARKLLREAGFEVDKIHPKMFANPMMVKMMYDNEGMRGVGGNGGEIHKEQSWCIVATRV